MAIYLIHAMEQNYGGQNGIEDWNLIEGTFEEAKALAQDMCIDLQFSFDFIADDLRTQAEEYVYEDGVTEFDWEERVEETEEQLAVENSEWYIYKIIGKSMKELLTSLRHGWIEWEEVRDLYGEEQKE